MGSSDERFNLLFMAQDAASGVIDSISGRLGKMALAFAGVGAAGAFLKSAIAEAAESQRVFAQLGATIERHGGSWKEAEAGVRSFATTLMLTTGMRGAWTSWVFLPGAGDRAAGGQPALLADRLCG